MPQFLTLYVYSTTYEIGAVYVLFILACEIGRAHIITTKIVFVMLYTSNIIILASLALAPSGRCLKPVLGDLVLQTKESNYYITICISTLAEENVGQYLSK